jgi:uroporphyrinogen decarboxylase
LTLCKSPDLVAEVTARAAEQIGADAAILFADILLIVEPLGFDLSFGEGEGPHIANPVRGGADVERMRAPQAGELDYVFEAVRRTRAALPGRVPLIGFAGAPFTVASYLCEGGSSRDFLATKALMYGDPGAWHALMAQLSSATAAYLNGQIDAGAQVVQIFDSWIGNVGPGDYREYVQPHVRALIGALRPGVPVIHFGTGTGALLEVMQQAGGDVIGLDFRVDLGEAWARLGDVAVMGNLDPAVLFSDPAFVRERARRVLEQAAGRPGHIFNLGHGIFPATPVDNVRALVDAVHEMSAAPARR